MMAAKLKTYRAEIDGLHEWIVAAPNQRAALDAFGVHQDLFAQGAAGVFDDKAGEAAARAQPGVPLRRPKGSTAPFKPVETGGAEMWTKAAAAAGKSAPKKPPSRAGLDRAETALAAFEAKAKAALDAIAEARAQLDAREAALRDDQDARRTALTKALEGARADYRAAGGRK
jgi:hypothetical protein